MSNEASVLKKLVQFITTKRKAKKVAKMGSLSKEQGFDNLGNHIYLEKQDKLRDIGVNIETSQIVVVGGQSSGKSSLLENLTGFSFPRGQGLCTRYATQITLKRSPATSIVISITPSNNATAKEKQDLRTFRRELQDFEPTQLAGVMVDASKAMGIRSGESRDDMNLPVFSDHILKIEISGPDKPHLTVIDVPGLFQVTDEGTTTANDKALVENMVQGYMANERTIVLAVMSCLADRATEGIMQFAKAADPKGERTVGVLTKADQVTENAVLRSVSDLVKGHTLKLGYFVVRNRGADEDDLSISQCRLKEKELFSRKNWADVAKLQRGGVESLKSMLQVLLTDLAKRALPKQRLEITSRLAENRKTLDAMGASRPDAASQREFLVKLASKFERIARDALEGRYEGDAIFTEKPELKLITKVVTLNHGFAETMWILGHNRLFTGKSINNATEAINKYTGMVTDAWINVSDIPELAHTLPNDYFTYPPPKNGNIKKHIKKCYEESQGPELGTFNGSLLAMIFRDQTSKWHQIVENHVSLIIIVVHQFIKDLLGAVFVEQQMLNELWDIALVEKLQAGYKRAMDQGKYLTGIEVNARPSTYNHYFADKLEKARLDHFRENARHIIGDSPDQALSISQLSLLATHKGNTDEVVDRLHDTLQAYYSVSRKRFVDAIIRQVIEYLLLEGPESPVKALSAELISGMTESQLDRIAGEDSTTKMDRERLNSEIQGLEEAMKVLRA